MKKRLSAFVLAFAYCLPASVSLAAEDLIPIRIGGQPTTPITSHVAQVFIHTDILARNGLKGDVKMFSSGAAVNEALSAGAIDVGFNGDMPSLALAAADAPVRVIGRQSQFRAALMATTKSGIKSLGELKGKNVYGPFGTSIHPMALDMLTQAGLRPGQDVHYLHMSPPDLADAVSAGRVEAFGLWDPWVENWQSKNLGRILQEDIGGFLVLVMRDDYMKRHASAAERFLKAHKEAVFYAVQNKELVNRWFVEAPAARALSPDVIDKATQFDPQWSAKSLGDVRLTFTEAEMKAYHRMAERAAELKIFPKVPPIDKIFDFKTAERLDKNVWSFDPNSVKVVK